MGSKDPQRCHENEEKPGAQSIASGMPVREWIFISAAVAAYAKNYVEI
jgi:hypothetical protein